MNTCLNSKITEIKGLLPSEDIIVFNFSSTGGKQFAVVYADGVADKIAIGELIIKPLRQVGKNCSQSEVMLALASPEVKEVEGVKQAAQAVSDGDAVLVGDGLNYIVVGVKKPPGRGVSEPPTQITIKGPREGFTEDIKTNLGLVRKRLKNDNLIIKNLTVGKQSKTSVAICYIKGICKEGLVEEVERKILSKEIDIIPDSSYIAGFITKRPRSLFRRNSTCEKPDIFCAKVCEGRVGIIVDGSPIALTLPYIIAEDFQSAEDYYSVSYRASILRLIRVVAIIIGIGLPAFYVCAQLFKIQLIPAKLLFKIASSVAGIPLSPSVEIFLTLFVLEVLNEASVRMPKYVGLALSVVGALVLGDTAVKSGIISTPAVIIIAFSAICLYTVPDMVETTATLRFLYLIIAGSLGTFGIVLLTAGIICYLCTEQAYGVPLLAPLSPMIFRDMSDSVYKANYSKLSLRPKVFASPNKRRLKNKNGK